MSEVLISLRGVGKTYVARGRSHVAVSDVSMDIHRGDFIALVGPSGCGKTTILKLLAELHSPDSGSIVAAPGAARVGMVFQQPMLLKWRTILENILLPAEILHLPMVAARTRARHLLELVGLGGLDDKYPQELSGGMQQRVAIARGLIHEPALLLMDEPFGALDALTRDRINLEMLRIWRDSGTTILFVTHSVPEAAFLGTHCAVLTAGPARMADYFAIDLPQPRTLQMRTGAEFGSVVRRIYEQLGMV